MAVTVLSVWFYGLGKHRTVIENSFISTSILSFSFFLFITIGLYNGIKLKDNLGKMTDSIELEKLKFLKNSFGEHGFDFIDFDDFGGIILSVILWIIVSILIGYVFFFFGAIVWVTMVTFVAMLYWIFYRALRLVFKNANECNGNISKSCLYGLGYTLAYNFWIYLIIVAVS
jgi:hypothetical protein